MTKAKRKLLDSLKVDPEKWALAWMRHDDDLYFVAEIFYIAAHETQSGEAGFAWSQADVGGIENPTKWLDELTNLYVNGVIFTPEELRGVK